MYPGLLYSQHKHLRKLGETCELRLSCDLSLLLSLEFLFCQTPIHVSILATCTTVVIEYL